MKKITLITTLLTLSFVTSLMAAEKVTEKAAGKVTEMATKQIAGQDDAGDDKTFHCPTEVKIAGEFLVGESEEKIKFEGKLPVLGSKKNKIDPSKHVIGKLTQIRVYPGLAEEDRDKAVKHFMACYYQTEHPDLKKPKSVRTELDGKKPKTKRKEIVEAKSCKIEGREPFKKGTFSTEKQSVWNCSEKEPCTQVTCE